jgi:photosystem II stability/assembly factor-like uncharacterized protein
MNMRSRLLIELVLSVFVVAFPGGEALANDTGKSESRLNAETFRGLALRNIGPALKSGRIADLVIHPSDESIWYAAVASGGIWKSANAGTTWTPIFDDQASYSIGCLATDPGNPNVIWAGTGEDVGSRHVAFGDGIYRTDDGGKTWQNMGLQESEHIARIIVSAEDSDVVYVAAQGPLWSKGGDRGFFKTTDGGKSWKKTLGDDEWTGVTDIVVDPRDPKRIYAATWQRHRNVAAYMGGGPKSGIYRSDDGGETWKKLGEGLPGGSMGKIGLAISFQRPDVVYAAIELNRRQGGLYRSTDRGNSWEKRSDTVSGGTGPQYYQELYASPHEFDRIYLMDVYFKVSPDGGKTFSPVNFAYRHGDSHALAFKHSDPDYIMVGDDGGIYESFDQAENWRWAQNLPVTQFYKVSVDDDEPFYNIYGGTQDHGSQGGPSRTDNIHGIQNSDWRLVLDWDGYQTATEPGNPDVIYAKRQEGHLARIDVPTGEVIFIEPQPEAGEEVERFNWDAPILVSPHDPARLYFASQRLWRSDNRGDKWLAISADLTRNQERMNLPVMGRLQSWDSPWDFVYMSNYNTITSISESPQVEGLIYVGTDDGLFQVTENGGDSWRTVEVDSLKGVPATAFINDIKADLFDADTVYIALDNHKFGDFSPYLFKSSNRGASWSSIRGDLPDRTLVWRIVQDHVKPGLLFAGTEFGLFFSPNAGKAWVKLVGGVPTIAFRDLAIQRRENDLVGASFGRSVFVLDDYSSLRSVSEEQLAEEATLFPTRKAWWYHPRFLLDSDKNGSVGASHYVAPNPDFGAVFTYHLRDGLKSKEQIRQASEKARLDTGEDIAFPGWVAVADEMVEPDPSIWIIVKDSEGNTVRRVNGPTAKGFNRVAWDLRHPAPESLRLNQPSSSSSAEPSGLLAAPGDYTATLSKEVDGEIKTLSLPVPFEVVPLRERALPGSSPGDAATFWRSYEVSVKTSTAVSQSLRTELARVDAMQKALSRAPVAPGELDERLRDLRVALQGIEDDLYGNRAKRQVGVKRRPTIESRLNSVVLGVYRSTDGPTDTMRRTLEIVNAQIQKIKSDLKKARADAAILGEDLLQAGAPWVEGSPL